MISSSEIRQKFIQYFESQGHLYVHSSPIVAKDDPTLLFTNAGMNQFKDNFLGTKPPVSLRIANTQKCLRASGKHNDLDDVGHDTYHHTMFEMLGNWSFGDYYKKESIRWAWELLTEVYRIPKDMIYVTIFAGDESDGLPMDEEAKGFWLEWVSEDRIIPCGRKDNFWEMGDTGPCGPCSEIHIDLRSQAEKEKVPGVSLVNKDDPQVIEIWNLVFMEFNRKADRSLESLPAKNVDTGMGLERLVRVIQSKSSNYDTDLFTPYIQFLEKEYGCKYGRSEEESIAMRVVMDHIRSVSFSLADGQPFSNGGAGYVVRRILRRASRYAFQFLNINEPFMYRLVDVLADIYKPIFPEMGQLKEKLKQQIKAEEASFLRTLERGSKLFYEYVRTHQDQKVVDGAFAFQLYDTFGFPIDLTEVMAREKGWTVDKVGYEAEMNLQKERSRAAGERSVGDWVEVSPINGMPVFVGYDQTEAEVKISRFRTIELAKGKAYQIVLDQTPFYAESGGQVGDSGLLVKGSSEIQVLDTTKENDLIVHWVDALPDSPEGEWIAQVDVKRREKIKANHSATHLLHAALRQVLGDHVAQAGSLVNDKLLRFDFSHHSKVTDEEIQTIEALVNSRISDGVSLSERREVPIAEAKSLGAMALFGEKYGDKVRVITFDPKFSVELCGGTHVANTQQIRLFKILGESSISAGTRRIEAVTSDGAYQFYEDTLTTLDTLKNLLKNPQDIVKSIEGLIETQKQQEKELERLQLAQIAVTKSALLGKAQTFGNVQLLAETVEVPNGDRLKSLAFDLRKEMKNTVIVLGTVSDGKPLLNVILTEDLENGRFHAGKLVGELAKEIGGGGGGQPFYASAGGKNPNGLSAAIEKAKSLIAASN
jgi:alanyl-tRNA synthetase